MKSWYNERIHTSYSQSFEISEVLYEKQTDHQHLIIFRNPVFGRVLALDGIIQTTEKDEFIYHEMFAHVPLFSHPNPKEVLIIGGGDGGLLREVLRHAGVHRVTLIEIDAEVVELSRRYLPTHSQGAFDDPRVQVVITEGTEYVFQCKHRYDVILTDSTDPVGPGKQLFEPGYYRNVINCLAPGGVLVAQNGVSLLQLGELVTTHQHLTQLVPHTGFFSAVVPTYLGGAMSFAWASRELSLFLGSTEGLQERFDQAGFVTRYYTPCLHRAAFALPAYVMEALSHSIPRSVGGAVSV